MTEEYPTSDQDDPRAWDEADYRDDDSDNDYIAPGAKGPAGTGVEGADDALIDDAGWDDVPYDEDEIDDTDDVLTAAEQGNRDGDAMAAQGDDSWEISDMSGDDLNVDALGVDPVRPVEVIDGLPEVIDGADDEESAEDSDSDDGPGDELDDSDSDDSADSAGDGADAEDGAGAHADDYDGSVPYEDYDREG